MPRKKKYADQRIRERRELVREKKNDPKPSTNNQLRLTHYDKTFDLSKPGVPSKTKDAPEPSANVEDDSKCERWKIILQNHLLVICENILFSIFCQF